MSEQSPSLPPSLPPSFNRSVRLLPPAGRNGVSSSFPVSPSLSPSLPPYLPPLISSGKGLRFFLPCHHSKARPSLPPSLPPFLLTCPRSSAVAKACASSSHATTRKPTSPDKEDVPVLTTERESDYFLFSFYVVTSLPQSLPPSLLPALTARRFASSPRASTTPDATTAILYPQQSAI